MKTPTTAKAKARHYRKREREHLRSVRYALRRFGDSGVHYQMAFQNLAWALQQGTAADLLESQIRALEVEAESQIRALEVEAENAKKKPRARR